MCMSNSRGVLPEKLGGGVRPASQDPYPIYDQNFPYPIYDSTVRSLGEGLLLLALSCLRSRR